MRHPWSIPARALAGLVVSAGLLLAVEGGLRLAGMEPPYQADLSTWRMAPSRDGQELTSREGVRFTFSTNADGLRSTATRARTPGVRRVALMGDSTVFGWGVDDGDTLADGLQRQLDDAYAYLGQVEVINAGQPGYSSAQISWFFDQVVQAYQPDLVVVFVPGHDNNMGVVSDWELLKGGQTWTASVRVFLAQNSRIYQLIRLLAYPRARQELLQPLEADAEHRVPRTSAAERALAYGAMQRRLATWNGRIAVGMLPGWNDLTGARIGGRTDAADVAAWSERQGAPWVDLRACCPGRTDFVLPADHGHFSAAGNRELGARIAPTVVDEVFLRPIAEGRSGGQRAHL